MGAFFSGFNFARFIILVCFVGSFPLGWLAYERFESNKILTAALQPGGEVETLVTRIQSNCRRYTDLKLAQRDETLFGGEQSDIQNYIRRHTLDDKINLGQVKIAPRKTPSTQYIDFANTITPVDSKATFSPTQIANFLFRLESESSRVKVTDIDIRNVSEKRRPALHDIPDDRWSLKATITTRQKIEKD